MVGHGSVWDVCVFILCLETLLNSLVLKSWSDPIRLFIYLLFWKAEWEREREREWEKQSEGASTYRFTLQMAAAARSAPGLRQELEVPGSLLCGWLKSNDFGFPGAWVRGWIGSKELQYGLRESQQAAQPTVPQCLPQRLVIHNHAIWRPGEFCFLLLWHWSEFLVLWWEGIIRVDTLALFAV